MKKVFYSLIATVVCFNALSQSYVAGSAADSIAAPTELQSTYIGFRFMLTDNSMAASNRNLQFRYTSLSNGYVMSHSMNINKLSNIPGVGLGIEETINGHLLINFAEGTVGYLAHMWNVTAGSGIGYALPINKKKNLTVHISANVFYENISYGLGSYYDSTLIGFEINGTNIGTSIKNVKYVNNLLCFNPALELIYRGSRFDFFIKAGYTRALLYKERLNFYVTRIPISSGLFDSSGGQVDKGAILPGSYTAQAGVIFEFGL